MRYIVDKLKSMAEAGVFKNVARLLSMWGVNVVVLTPHLHNSHWSIGVDPLLLWANPFRHEMHAHAVHGYSLDIELLT